MQKIPKTINPWTGKQKATNQKGMLNQIMNKYYPQYEKVNKQRPYIKMTEIIQQYYQPQLDLKPYAQLFDIDSKCSKINDILQWYQKVEKHKSANIINSNQQIPIDSSYVYLPLHSGTLFHQLLKQGLSVNRQSIIDDNQILQLKKQIENLKNIMSIETEILNNIL